VLLSALAADCRWHRAEVYRSPPQEMLWRALYFQLNWPSVASAILTWHVGQSRSACEMNKLEEHAQGGVGGAIPSLLITA